MASKKIINVEADTKSWGFTPTAVTLMGHTFPAQYSLSTSEDVYVFAVVDDIPCRIHIGKGTPMYHTAFEAAMLARKVGRVPAKPAKPVEAKPEQPAKQAERKAKSAAQPAKPVETKQAEAKPEQPAKQAKRNAKSAEKPAKPVEAKAEQPAKQAVPAKDAWIGTAITGKGWRIAFDADTQRTRVTFDAAPSAKQKGLVEELGFYYSAALKSWNKKLTAKAYRAAQNLAAQLTALA